jgi:mannose-6-phosphate isomerase-like protein (cupin superfamily)
MRMIVLGSLAMAMWAVQAAGAQAPSVDHFTRGEILEKAKSLTLTNGSGSTKLNEYPNHYTMVALRHKDGGAELHQDFADIFFVVQGKATLLSGGEVDNAKTASPGEIRGTAVKNGTSTPLGEGDVVHIPAGVPHQMLVSEGETFVYFVVKAKEK